MVRQNSESRNMFKEYRYYPAVQLDAFNITHGGGVYKIHNNLNPIIICLYAVPLSLLDLPISVLTDTVMLPFDLSRAYE